MIATHLIHLPQLPKLVSLIHILGQPACPKVIDQRPIQSYISCTLNGCGALTGMTKPWPIVQVYAARLCGTIPAVAVVALAAKYHGGQIIVLPIPCTQTVVKWRCRPSMQTRFMFTKVPLQTKGTTGDQIGYAHCLVCQAS